MVGLPARVMCRTPVESVESHCKATHQVLAQVCGHFLYNFIYILLEEIFTTTFSTDSVSAIPPLIHLRCTQGR